ncbi:uncharacterized protein LOC143430624 isoform X2 [Xylocopa sonorina]|uniref:uncharacterized protein LOC143430624 isoform X2 n=1 Tax=Xylocopa sonorina TaxID=1818115 RepID=UPI00403A7E4D
MLQENKAREGTVFDISYYKAFKKYLLFLGQYPTQSRWSREFNTIVVLSSIISLLIPSISQFCMSILEKNLDAAMESVPVVVTLVVCMIKLLNHKINKDKFDTLFDLMKEEWDLLNHKYQVHILHTTTKQGNMLAEAYRTTLLSFLVIFLLLPLFPLFFDVILPLNETRQRYQMFRLKYFVNEDQYFFSIYFHSIWCSFVVVIIIVSIDSLYMLIVHHACGLFALCGYQIEKAMKCNDANVNGISIESFRRCAVMHNKALQFYQIIDDSSRLSYFFQVLFNMIGITVTAVQTVMYLHRPEEALRIAVFLVAQQFHLLVITLPGQVLVDQSLQFANDIYDSTWYQMPRNIQKVLHTMQLRSTRACKLTAGGLYEMNIENFGVNWLYL